MSRYLQNSQEQNLFEMATSRDRQSEKVDALQAELATVDQLQANRASLGESIVAAKHHVEEIDLQLEQEQHNREERSW